MTFLSGLSLQGGDQQLETRQCCWDGSRELKVDFSPKGEHYWVMAAGECDSGKAMQEKSSHSGA